MGIDLLSAGVKDIILPGDVKDIINQVLIDQLRQAFQATMGEQVKKG